MLFQKMHRATVFLFLSFSFATYVTLLTIPFQVNTGNYDRSRNDAGVISMKKDKVILFAIISALLFYICPTIAYADSSWVWVSETRPYDVLPWTAILTIAIETFSINYIPKVHKLPKTFCLVTLANLLSFAAPYGVNLLLYDESGFDFSKYLEHWPSYTVGLIYCFMTIAVELPLVYGALRKNAGSKRSLLLTIICSNAATTCMVAVIERIFCRGGW